MAQMTELVELDSVEITVIVDNELDPISASPNPSVQQSGSLKDLGLNGSSIDRGGARRLLRMSDICCGAHGLSLMITGVRHGQRHTLMFDTGPEAAVWERNATRLKADIGSIERIHLSHWHRDHSGGMLKAVEMISTSKASDMDPVIVDLHPDRPAFRGIMTTEPVSWEADPSFSEIEAAGGKVAKNDQPHTVLENMFLISGEVPRVTSYELGLKRGIRFDETTDSWVEDTMIRDERFVACKVKEKGLVVFTGCSHAGVVNTVKHAVQLQSRTPLYCVMGGYHLADAEPELIDRTVQDLKELDAKVLLTGHCTGWRAKFRIQEEMPGRLVPSFVGSKFVL